MSGSSLTFSGAQAPVFVSHAGKSTDPPVVAIGSLIVGVLWTNDSVEASEARESGPVTEPTQLATSEQVELMRIACVRKVEAVGFSESRNRFGPNLFRVVLV